VVESRWAAAKGWVKPCPVWHTVAFTARRSQRPSINSMPPKGKAAAKGEWVKARVAPAWAKVERVEAKVRARANYLEAKLEREWAKVNNPERAKVAWAKAVREWGKVNNPVRTKALPAKAKAKAEWVRVKGRPLAVEMVRAKVKRAAVPVPGKARGTPQVW
jgi:hypothetical protein